MKELIGVKDYIRWIFGFSTIVLCFMFPEWKFWVLFCLIGFFLISEVQMLSMRFKQKQDEMILETLESTNKRCDNMIVDKDTLRDIVMTALNQIMGEARKRGKLN